MQFALNIANNQKIASPYITNEDFQTRETYFLQMGDEETESVPSKKFWSQKIKNSEGEGTLKQRALKFGLSRCAISFIDSGVNWKHLSKK